MSTQYVFRLCKFTNINEPIEILNVRFDIPSLMPYIERNKLNVYVSMGNGRYSLVSDPREYIDEIPKYYIDMVANVNLV